MEKIVDLFTSLRVLPKAYDDDRTDATLQLMQYLKQTDRQDKYVKYVHGTVHLPLMIFEETDVTQSRSDLCKQHEDNNNHVEAGLTLLLHADLYDWSENTVPPMGPITSSEVAWERKVHLRAF